MLEPGFLLDGKYKILKVIGAGGMSVVYLAVNERANKHWAVKEIRKDGCSGQVSEIARQSLIAETDILKKMRHKSLPQIIDVIDGEDSLLIVMDYIEGQTLQEILIRSGPQPPDKVLDWAGQLCDVLAYLHSREPPIIYRDIKPSNIMLTPQGRVVLIDFGTAREMKPARPGDTVCLGTRGYAAPEQYGGAGQTDARTDIYCLGVTLHHLLTGHDPNTPPYTLYPLKHWDPALPDGMWQVIRKCTRDDPASRYQSCEELRFDLDHFEKLEAGYRRTQEARLRSFFLCLAFTGLMGMASMLTGVYSCSLIREEYRGYLEQARQAQQLKDMTSLVKRAVSLDRGNPEAYRTMLAWMTSDSLFSDQEKSVMESLLYEKKNGRQNIILMRRHRKGYDAFSYEMGLACFFYYKGTRGKEIARLWFEGLKKSSLSDGQKARAFIYARIGSYYSSLGHTDRKGEDEKGGYGELFRDLSALNDFSPVDIGNSRAAVALYCEIAGQIGANAGNILKEGEGITADELRREIRKIRKYMTDSNMKTAGTEDMEKLAGNLEDAEAKIDAAAGSWLKSGTETVQAGEEFSREKAGTDRSEYEQGTDYDKDSKGRGWR